MEERWMSEEEMEEEWFALIDKQILFWPINKN